ncbi:MAG: patatin-like phospholipase family protein [Spirochaetaceae bacterium]|jgi:NTE family protein|nr:patatin-like phospholipase family protein [Spirochaetaceae bacterium]
MRIDSNLKWALVLSGGGAKGIAHVGVLKALSEMGFPEPSLVVGTSMGAIVGGLYACGLTAADLCRFIRDEFDITNYLDSFVFKLAGPVGRIFQAGQFLGALASGAGIDSGNQVLALMEELTGGKTFDQTRIPFRCNAVDLLSGREVVLRSGSVARAIRASMSFPVFFEPLREGGMCLVDGGLVDNMPIHIAKTEGIKRIMAVDVGNFRIIPGSDFTTGYKILYRSLEVVLHQMNRLNRDNRPDLLVHAAGKATPFAFNKKNDLIALGERVIRENEAAVKAFFGKGFGARVARRRYTECGARPGEAGLPEKSHGEVSYEQTAQEH